MTSTEVMQSLIYKYTGLSVTRLKLLADSSWFIIGFITATAICCLAIHKAWPHCLVITIPEVLVAVFHWIPWLLGEATSSQLPTKIMRKPAASPRPTSRQMAAAEWGKEHRGARRCTSDAVQWGMGRKVRGRVRVDVMGCTRGAAWVGKMWSVQETRVKEDISGWMRGTMWVGEGECFCERAWEVPRELVKVWGVCKRCCVGQSGCKRGAVSIRKGVCRSAWLGQAEGL